MASVRLVNPGKLRARRHRRQRMPTALRRYWATHRRAGKRIVRTNSGRRRRRNMPAGLKKYWSRVRAALKSRSSNRRRRGVNRPMAKRRRRRRSMPAGLRRYWASHRRERTHNPRRRRRNRAFHFGRRRNRTRVVYMSARRRSRRHNPLLAVPMGELIPLTAWAIGGMAGTRIIPQMILPQYNSGLGGYGLNFVAAVGLSWIGGKFAGTRASQGLLVGGMVGLAARMLSDALGSSTAGAWGLSGDLDFDLGFYIPNSFAVPTTGQGPYLLQPGITGSPMASGGMPTALAAPAAAGCAAGTGAPTAAQLAAATATTAPASGGGGGGGQEPNRWHNSWAA